jgi:hypothetical protein
MSTNNITGDKIATRIISEEYRDNYDAIFKKKLVRSIPTLTKKENEFYNKINTSSVFTLDKLLKENLRCTNPSTDLVNGLM